MTVRIVTDSACDLSEAMVTDLGIEIVPLSIRFGDDEYTDRVDLTVDGFYDKMAESEHLPQTAAPSPGAFEAAFRRSAETGADEVVCINLSLALSATGLAAANAAAALADELPVTCFDSKSITSGLGTMVIRAARAAADGASVAEILTLVEGLRERTRVYGALDTLDNLKKGGRIGGAQALLGTVLSIKPCLDLSSGEVVEAGRQRTRKKAFAWLRDIVAEAGDVEDLAVAHGNAPDVGELLATLGELVPADRIRVEQLGAVIGSHGGPRVVGVTFLPGDGTR